MNIINHAWKLQHRIENFLKEHSPSDKKVFFIIIYSWIGFCFFYHLQFVKGFLFWQGWIIADQYLLLIGIFLLIIFSMSLIDFWLTSTFLCWYIFWYMPKHIYTTYYIHTIMIKNIEGKKIKCKCGYEWLTKSKNLWVCCPRCMNKVKVPKEWDEINGT